VVKTHGVRTRERAPKGPFPRAGGGPRPPAHTNRRRNRWGGTSGCLSLSRRPNPNITIRHFSIAVGRTVCGGPHGGGGGGVLQVGGRAQLLRENAQRDQAAAGGSALRAHRDERTHSARDCAPSRGATSGHNTRVTHVVSTPWPQHRLGRPSDLCPRPVTPTAGLSPAGSPRRTNAAAPPPCCEGAARPIATPSAATRWRSPAPAGSEGE
jgi:hypothetical protein